MGETKQASAAFGHYKSVCILVTVLVLVLVGYLVSIKGERARGQGKRDFVPTEHVDSISFYRVTKQTSSGVARDGTTFLQRGQRWKRSRANLAVGIHASPPRTAFIYRTFNPSQAMAYRIAKAISELLALAQVDSWISVNVQEQHNDSVQRLFQTLAEQGLRVQAVHRYTEGNVKSAFPALLNKGRIAWQYHCQAVDLWWREQKQMGYEHVWISEDDLGYSGEMSTLLLSYVDSKDDLLMGAYYPGGPGYEDVHPNWKLDTPTSAWRAHSPPYKRLHGTEFLVRHSARLLNKLHEWSERGEIDLSESMQATVCKVEGLNCGVFANEDVGSPFAWNGRMEEQSWRSIMANSSHGKLFHALKF